MAIAKIKFESKKLQRDIRLLARALEHGDSFWNEIGKSAVKTVRKNIDRGGRPSKWVPRKKKYSWPILKKTKALYRSIKYRIGKESLIIYSNLVYASRQNWGYNKNGISHPARPYLVIPQEDEKGLAKIVQSYLVSAFLGRR